MVPQDWELKPSGLTDGDKFRLLFTTSKRINAESTNITYYNMFVQNRAKAGHNAITDSCGNQFKVVGSTSAVDAQDNTSTTGTGEAIYWLNGAKVADNYADFYDETWDNRVARTEAGTVVAKNFNDPLVYHVFSGSNRAGRQASTGGYLGSTTVTRGHLFERNPFWSEQPNRLQRTVERRFYALSPIFTVSKVPVLSLSLDSTSGHEHDTGSTNYVGITISLSRTRPRDTNFDLCVKNTSTAIFRTATGGKARDFDIPNIKADDNNCISLKLYADLSLIYPWHNICEKDPTAHLQCQNRSIQTSLAIFGDTRPEENETVILELRNQPNAVEVSSTAGTATYTILNDDGTPPTITISGGAAVTEGTAAGFTLNSSPAPSEKLTVQLDVSDKEDNGSNFVAARDEGRKTVSIGTSGSATYTVPTDDDNTDEPHGVVTVTIAEGDGYTVGNTSSAMVTVNDDDVPVTITESGTPAATTVSEDGATTDTYTVVLNSAPSHSVTVTATAGDGVRVQGSGGTEGATAALTFTTTNWNQAQTITVTGVDDDIDNAGDARTVTIAHAARSSDPSFAIADAGSVSVTVTDDDTAGLVFQPDPVSVYEGNSGSYTVALASQPSANVTVTISGQGGTDLKVDTDSVMAGDQATLTFTTSNWSVAQPVSIEAAQD